MLWKEPTLEKFMKDHIPWEEPHAGVGEECDEEGMTQTRIYELTTSPIPHPPALHWGKEL